MEKRVLGVVFTILGALGLVMAAVNFVNAGGGTRSVKMIVIYALLGMVFFFSGMGLIRNTKDRPS
ncbi:hypothetical protein [Chitinophaga sancti]|uniref:Uncharacterized protein n=1 Tax=Chitinophaga sancti TaxID=1004 RepID=A0A1K1QY27_9BACT|nr:hypothetical protein [Chitinophaga sancti]WQD62052.1 hypothetical protein U0033_29625 [Chitinophaga sancti]WQG92379.1 hypothetical protein SR876_12760 [Chitinophaga sancti]SFW64596.1 hypothetical protein SAMN05661012_03189 [Chitinophaga sancti]